MGQGGLYKLARQESLVLIGGPVKSNGRPCVNDLLLLAC